MAGAEPPSLSQRPPEAELWAVIDAFEAGWRADPASLLAHRAAWAVTLGMVSTIAEERTPQRLWLRVLRDVALSILPTGLSLALLAPPLSVVLGSLVSAAGALVVIAELVELTRRLSVMNELKARARDALQLLKQAGPPRDPA